MIVVDPLPGVSVCRKANEQVIRRAFAHPRLLRNRAQLGLCLSRNSAFAYKGRAVNVRQIGRELGVAYVLEGSVQRAKASPCSRSGDAVGVSKAHIWELEKAGPKTRQWVS